ncbi:MAG TPA: FkbM family methyltransferase [Propylenella sp.]|nr:FkbM family methyltransferase [Propylenella sp.]
MQDRALLEFHRLALSWHAMRNGHGRAVSLKRDGELLRVHDGVRQLCVPHLSWVPRFRSGVNTELDAVAAKYVGATGYVPREGDVVVDIGAGIGEFALWCSDAGASVVAFEPDPLAFACLERNIPPRADVRSLPYALWKERVNLRLHGSADTTESSLIEDGKTKPRLADVEAWPLDQVPEVIALPVIDFMKVDGEGVEPEILAGGMRTLRRTRIIAVDVSATGKRPNLATRVETILDSLSFKALLHDRSDSILALNTAMVGPFNSRAAGRPGS